MTAIDPSTSDKIVLFADGRPYTPPPLAPLFGLFLILVTAGGAAFAMDFRIAGVLLIVLSSIVLIATLEETGIVTTFDFTRRQITIGKNGIFRRTTKRTLPFDVVKDLSIKPEEGGVLLWLKDGTTLKATGTSSNYVRLSNSVAHIKARLSIGAAQPARSAHPSTASSRDISSALDRVVTFAASGRPGRGFGVLGFIFAGGLFYLPTVLLLSSSAPLPTTTGKIFLILLLLLITLPLFAIGFLTLFGQTPKLLLDPTTRQAHFDWSWPVIWPRETIAFDDFAAAGVCEGMSGRDGQTVEPYIQLVSGRQIDLLYYSNSFRTAEDIALVICRMTGAEFRNISELDELFDGSHSRRPEKLLSNSE